MIWSLFLAAFPLAALATAANDALAQDKGNASSASRTEAVQIEMPIGDSAAAGPGRAYLGNAVAPTEPRDSLVQNSNNQISQRASNAPTSQISARGQGGSGMAQLSGAELEASLAQLTPAERRVLLQTIEGTDICDNPPEFAAILALCQARLETRAADFAGQADRPSIAEEQLLRGDLESDVLPSFDQVIERLARGGGSSEDLSAQAIASIALGSSATASSGSRDEEQPDTADFGEEAQALINALINQLGGRSP